MCFSESKTKTDPVDVQNHRLWPGDQIAYPDRKGSSLWMNVGIIEQIKRNPVTKKVTGLIVTDVVSYRYGAAQKHQRASLVTALDRVVLV